MAYEWAKNKHGIEGYWSDTGRWGRDVPDPLRPGKTYFQSHQPVFVPKVCSDCPFFNPGEWDDYYQISPPYCERNVWFPTKKGICQIRERYTQERRR